MIEEIFSGAINFKAFLWIFNANKDFAIPFTRSTTARFSSIANNLNKVHWSHVVKDRSDILKAMNSVTAHKYPVNDFVYFAIVTARDGYYINVSHQCETALSLGYSIKIITHS